MSIVFALKVALVPSLIGGVTLAGRRWGPGVAGWLSAFPVVSAPILFFLALEQGAEFAGQASAATLSAVLAMLVFGASYAWAARRCSWMGSTLIAFTSYFTAVAALNVWAPSLSVSGACVLLALFIAPRVYPKPPSGAGVSTTRSRYDIWWRMLAGAVLVVLVTHFSSLLGPRLSGLFAEQLSPFNSCAAWCWGTTRSPASAWRSLCRCLRWASPMRLHFPWQLPLSSKGLHASICVRKPRATGGPTLAQLQRRAICRREGCMSAVGQPYDATRTVFIRVFSVGTGWLTTTASSVLSALGKRFLPARTAFEVVFKVSDPSRGARLYEGLFDGRLRVVSINR